MSFHTMRNKKRELTKEEALAILEKGEYGTLSTVDGEGQPYGVPLSYVVYNGSIYFHCASEGHKLENIRHSDRVCFSAVGRAETDAPGFTVRYESAVVFGRAQQAPKAEWHEVLLALCAKYSPGYEEKAEANIVKWSGNLDIVRITIDHITGKANRG